MLIGVVMLLMAFGAIYFMMAKASGHRIALQAYGFSLVLSLWILVAVIFITGGWS